MSQQDKKALNDQDAITAAHLVIKATLKTLGKALEKNSFDLRQFESALAEARSKGPIEKMQMNMKSVAGLIRITRNAFDATTMLLERTEKGLDENALLRARIVELEAAAAKKDGVFSTEMARRV